MSSQSLNPGIQTLLEAERDAAKTVAKARQYRTQRLKDAKTEAQKEIDALKSQKEQEFKAFVSTISSTASFERIDKETEAKLQSIKAAYSKNHDKVLQKLLDSVCRVEPEIHRNIQVQQQH